MELLTVAILVTGCNAVPPLFSVPVGTVMRDKKRPLARPDTFRTVDPPRASTMDLTSWTQTWLDAQRDFGAAGTGLVDDAPALQRAIDMAVEEGSTLHLPNGTYRIDTQLNVPTCHYPYGSSAPQNLSPLRIIGAGEYQTTIFANRSMHAVIKAETTCF